MSCIECNKVTNSNKTHTHKQDTNASEVLKPMVKSVKHSKELSVINPCGCKQIPTTKKSRLDGTRDIGHRIHTHIPPYCTNFNNIEAYQLLIPLF